MLRLKKSRQLIEFITLWGWHIEDWEIYKMLKNI